MKLSFKGHFHRARLDRFRVLLLIMIGFSVASFFFRLPLNMDQLLLRAGSPYMPASFIEILIKAAILGFILSIIISDFTERTPLPTPEDIAPLKWYGELTFKSKIMKAFLAVFTGPSEKLKGVAPAIRTDLLKSNLNLSPDAFFSILMFTTLISISASVVGAVLYFMYNWIYGLILIPVPFFVFIIGLQAPKLSQSGRAGALSHELPYVIGYFNILASGGISPVVALRKLSNAAKLFPATASESKRILLDIDVFGHDPLSTFEKVARFNPNRIFADFFAGYSVTIRIGGDVSNYIDVKMKDIFSRGASVLRSAGNLIGALAESYISVTVILGIVLFVLFSVQSITTGGPAGGIDPAATQTSLLFSTVFVPMVSILIIYIVHVSLPKEPTSYNAPFIAFFASLIVIPIMFLIPLNIDLPLRLGVGLIIPTIPAGFLAIRESIHKRGVESMLPSFVADITEVRKTGLSPEKGIEQLSGRNYGHLTKHVKNMSAQLSWGVPLDKVMINFSNKVRSWTVRAITFLIIQVVEVGGGTVKMFTNLSDFTQQVSELERERRSMLRPYIFIPYFGAIMLVATTIMMLSLITAPIGPYAPQVNPENIKAVTTTLFTAAIVQSWFMGFVAGKMGEGSLAGGFKHAGAMVALCLITIYVIENFMPSLF